MLNNLVLEREGFASWFGTQSVHVISSTVLNLLILHSSQALLVLNWESDHQLPLLAWVASEWKTNRRCLLLISSLFWYSVLIIVLVNFIVSFYGRVKKGRCKIRAPVNKPFRHLSFQDRSDLSTLVTSTWFGRIDISCAHVQWVVNGYYRFMKF